MDLILTGIAGFVKDSPQVANENTQRRQVAAERIRKSTAVRAMPRARKRRFMGAAFS
jgi:hypothetical protein